MTNKYVALARVSSREQQREGFSLDVQEEALQRYVQRQGGEIVQLYRIAETASKDTERKVFKELLAYARKNARLLSGVLFYKVDRAARNLFDYVELERLELDYSLPVIYVAQPTENTPAGRMQRRIPANMASFYTEQQSLDVREGQERRVKEGLFPCKAPYGYRNVRVDGRSIVQVDPEAAAAVGKIFELYAYHNHTLDSLREALKAQGVFWTDYQRDFARSKLHAILTDRCYIGEVKHRGQWHSGSHTPLVDRGTFDRVQVLLGDKAWNPHESVYGSGMITCGHCGRPVVVEMKTKKTKAGPKDYHYYRCARYNSPGHPSVRVTQSILEQQVLALFDRMKVQDEKVHAWVVKVLQAKSKARQHLTADHVLKLQAQLAKVKHQQDRLLNMRLAGEIEADTFAAKSTELRDRESQLSLEIDAQSRQEAERGDVAVKVFELSQSLGKRWVAADIAEKRQLLGIICLNWTLEGTTLVPTMRKPFDILAEGPSLTISRRTGI